MGLQKRLLNDHAVEVVAIVIYGLAIYLTFPQLIGFSIFAAENMIPAAARTTKMIEALFICIWLMTAAFRALHWSIQKLFCVFEGSEFDNLVEAGAD